MNCAEMAEQIDLYNILDQQLSPQR